MKKHDHLIISIDYDEGKPDTFRAVEVKAGKFEAIFSSANTPQKNFNRAWRYAQREATVASFKSSVDHFIQDGGELDTREFMIGYFRGVGSPKIDGIDHGQLFLIDERNDIFDKILSAGWHFLTAEANDINQPFLVLVSKDGFKQK